MTFIQVNANASEDLKVTLSFLFSLELEDLDEMVTDMSYCNVNNELNATADLDCHEHILCSAESVACEVNNMGKEAQVMYLIKSGFRAHLKAS